jgi:hypothetical protein
MMNINLMPLLAVTFLVAACSNTPSVSPIEVSYTPVDKPELILPEVESITTREVNWIVITEDNFEEVVAELKARGESISFFAVTADGYEAISINLANIQKLVKQQKSVIAAYERYNNE